ncbi:hypothetical protein DPX16_17093 [Anabarilius grahami]|uniref:Uncharacterized protein n=1 Tax=Anabarilius grahami TaxID=495550 RepID=A0A3N0YAN5_ANAGA|nr:hypothetical protein DPX16_17093 [Anabarilius grahami]
MANSKHEPNRQKRAAQSQTTPLPPLLPAMRREAAWLCFCLVQQERQGMTDVPMNQTGHLERFYHSHKYITAAVDAFSTQRELQSCGCQLK